MSDRLGPDLRLVSNIIRYGTETYPEKVARRLRVLNIAALMATAISVFFAVVQFFGPSPGMRMIALFNATAAVVFAAVPLLHRFGPLVALMVFTLGAYFDIFIICYLLGTNSGMQFYYLVALGLLVLFLGSERLLLASLLGVVAAVLIIALQVLAPNDSGLQSTASTLGNFIATAFASCAMLFAIVIYAMLQISRAEEVAEREYERSETLLRNILPATVARRLKGHAHSVIADKYEEASILFADMAGFTARASDTPPDDLVRFLNRVFTDFDRLVEQHRLEKIKTTGDAYIVVSGVPMPRPDHAEALADLALDMRAAAEGLHDPYGRPVPIRMGIGTGPVVAGVVGTQKFFYDIWGDAVNVAARMESTGIEGKIQVSQESYQRLKEDFCLEERGRINVKGKGRMRTWFLAGRKAYSVSDKTA